MLKTNAGYRAFWKIAQYVLLAVVCLEPVILIYYRFYIQ